MPVDDVFSLQPNASSPPDNNGVSPSITPPPKTPKPAGGGEIHRIREALMQERLAYFQEAESRRPDYMKRAKRTLDEADPSALEEDERTRQLDREALVGITESPTKGRRLKLFQETSDESFEESLMAGGYGRYVRKQLSINPSPHTTISSQRTAEWVRQPQPMLLATAGPAGPSNVVSMLEKTQEVPPTEKELKKRKRLAAFRGSERHITKLHPTELEGRGRVLLDLSGEEDTQATQDTPLGKKKGGGRRKKKGGELTAKEKKSLATAAEAAGPDLSEKPNWPDMEFPWRLRQLERTEEVKAVAAEKLRWIERFLDGDSDSDDEDEPSNTRLNEEEVYEERDVYEAASQPIRRGRGKMVPLSASPNGRPQAQRKSAFFPTDPADARAALLSKKSVRTLSYRQQRRKRRQEEDSDDEILCLCNGVDDGRELVQCDGCETWYHLQCIGIKDIAELGNEEDPWYCRECDEYGCRSPASELPELSSEPTFAPTADAPQLPSYDPPFYQPPVIQDSPMPWTSSRMPQTPTRRSRGAEHHHESSGSSWVDSSRSQPSTPQHPAPHVKVYTGPYDSYEEPPFDPTSTPSRGMKIGPAYVTPKNNLNAWSTRANGMFQTPLRTTGGRNSWGRTSAGLSALFETGGMAGYGGIPHTDESPIGRKKSGEGPQARRFLNSPLASRLSMSMPHSLFDGSPVMRFEEPGRRQD